MERINILESEMTCRILGIDNGTDKVGFTVGDYNIRTGVIDIVLCETYEVPTNYRAIRNGSYERRGSFITRVEMIGDYFETLLDEYQPHLIGCESPFGFRMMDPFKKLTISMQLLDDIAYSLYPHVDFIKISPFEAKKAAAGDDKFQQDKEKVHEYVLKNEKIVWPRDIDPRNVGSEALDSVTVTLATANYVLL